VPFTAPSSNSALTPSRSDRSPGGDSRARRRTVGRRLRRHSRTGRRASAIVARAGSVWRSAAKRSSQQSREISLRGQTCLEFLGGNLGERISSVLTRSASLQGVVESRGGDVVKATGDGYHAAFATARNALSAAAAGQRGSPTHPGEQRVRCGCGSGSTRATHSREVPEGRLMCRMSHCSRVVSTSAARLAEASLS
jgi:hypothetical protein